MADRSVVAGSPPNPRGGAMFNAGRGMGTFSKRSNVEPRPGPYTLTEEIGDQRKPEQAARLYEESVGYANLAGDKFVREQAKMAVQAAVADTFNVNEFLRNKFLVLYRLWRGETIAQHSYGRIPLHSPEPFKIIETIHPRIMRAMFGTSRWFKLYGTLNENDPQAQAQEILCRDQLRKTNFKRKASRFIRDGLIYGTAVQKVYWKQEVGEMRYRTAKRVPNEDYPGSTKLELSEIKQPELVFDGNCIENVSIFDVFAPPNASSVEEAEWMADRSAWPDYKVKQMGELGHWMHLEQLKEHPGTSSYSFGDEFKERKSYAYGVFDPQLAKNAPHIPHYEVFDWWGPLVVKQDGQSYTTKMCNVVVIEPKGICLVVRVTENPFWHREKPYVAWRPISVEDEFFGVGAIEMIAKLSYEKDEKRNLGMAAAQLEANPMLLVNDDANIPDGQFIFSPGKVIRVPDVQNSVAPLYVPQVSDAAVKAEGLLTQDIRETAGTTSPVMGAMDPGGSKTAAQHLSEVDEAGSRMLTMIENYECDVTEPLLSMMTWNNQQFMSYPVVVRDTGAIGLRFRDRYEIKPEELIGRFLVQPLVGQRLIVRQTIVQQLVNILDRGPVINQMYPNAVKLPKLLAMILDKGFDIRDVDEYVTVPPEEAGLLTAIEEHELWYHGKVPPRRPDDNDMRHYVAHLEEFKEERFAQLQERHPQVANQAIAHAAEHARKIALMQEIQEKAMMEAAQLAAMQGMGGGESPVAGAAGPGQEPGSPKFRDNEMERGEGEKAGDEAKSSSMKSTANTGAQ